MTHTTVYLFGQLVSIAARFILIIYVISQYRKRKYSLYYAVVRLLFYNDNRYIKWFNDNPIYLYYLAFNACSLLAEAGLLQQISDGTLYTKPIVFFFSAVGFVVCVMMIISELLKKISSLEKI